MPANTEGSPRAMLRLATAFIEGFGNTRDRVLLLIGLCVSVLPPAIEFALHRDVLRLQVGATVLATGWCLGTFGGYICGWLTVRCALNTASAFLIDDAIWLSLPLRERWRIHAGLALGIRSTLRGLPEANAIQRAVPCWRRSTNLRALVAGVPVTVWAFAAIGVLYAAGIAQSMTAVAAFIGPISGGSAGGALAYWSCRGRQSLEDALGDTIEETMLGMKWERCALGWRRSQP